MRPDTLERLTFACGYLSGVAEAIRADGTAAVATGDHVEVIRHFDQLRKANSMIKTAREALEEMEQRLSREQVPDVMRSHGIKTTTIEGVGRVSLSNRWSCSMLDKEAGMKWLRNNDAESLIQETVNSQTLASFAKSYAEDKGLDLPGDIFKTGIMTYTSITKA